MLPDDYRIYGSVTAISPAISPTIGTTPDPLVKTIRYVDPLILDLDGDGLEISPLSQGVLFDANGDTIKTGTAWAAADDGMLVWDRDGNGLIDSGKELFGDETVLANGQKAAHGFAALRELDKGSTVNGSTVGSGDGVFDAKDAQYANLRIWRDLNQDGVSQTGELQTLAQTGVQSINLVSNVTQANYGDAQLVQSGNYTRVDGSGNTSLGQAGSFILAQNNFVRAFTPITVSDAAKAVANIGGSGWVRDLQEAATQSPELVALFNQAKDAPTRADYTVAVANLLREWGNDSGYSSASKQAQANGFGLILSDPVSDQERGWMDKAIKASDQDRDAYRATLDIADRALFDAMRERMVGGLEKIQAYEAFTGYTFLNWNQIRGDAFNDGTRVSLPTAGRPVEVWVPLSQIMVENRNAFMSIQSGYIRVNVPTPPSGTPHIESLWSRLVDDATMNLMPSVRLSKYLDMVDLQITDTGIRFDFGRMDAGLAADKAVNTQEGVALLLDLYRSQGVMLDGMGWNGAEQVRALMQQGVADVAVRGGFEIAGMALFTATASAGTDASDAFIGDAGANAFNAGAGDDILDGQDGNDGLSGGFGDDVMFGDAGNDFLYGNAGNDTLDGGAGNDVLMGDAFWTGAGSDTYLLGRGGGQDTIRDYDLTAGVVDKLVFKAGIAASDVLVSRDGGTLLLKINGTADQMRIDNYFDGDATGGWTVEEIRFTDAPGTVWTVKTIQNKLNPSAINNMAGTAGHDTLVGTAGSDAITGLAGNDLLDGGASEDSLSGGLGNDIYVVDHIADVVLEAVDEGTDLVRASVDYFLSANVEHLTLVGTAAISGVGNALNNILTGNSGNNTLDGGAGADTLLGGAGNDTYVVDNAADVVTENANEGIDLVQASIGYTLGVNVENLTLTGIAATNATGNTLNNALTGNNANNTLNGGAGADTLVGGLGNDIYVVDNAGDVVLEGLNEGADTVQSSVSATLATNVEHLVLTGSAAINATGNAQDNTLVANAGNNLLDGAAGSDTANYGSAAAAVVVSLGLAGPQATGGSGSDTLLNIENLSGSAFNDSLTGNAGNNALNGAAGADTLLGGLGNDTYTVDNAGDLVVENREEGADTVNASIAYTLGDHVERLNLTGTAAVAGTGNALNNILIGNAANNTLTGDAAGEAGAAEVVNSLVVYAKGSIADGGWPTMEVWIAGVKVQSFTVGTTDYAAYTITAPLGVAARNVDVVFSNDAYNATAGQDRNLSVGQLVVNGRTIVTTSGASGVVDYGTGAAALDWVNTTVGSGFLGSNSALRVGLNGGDWLDGGAGADTLAGGFGNDVYVVDNAVDVVQEAADAGHDIVRASVSYALGSPLEDLELTGTQAINATGNAGRNSLRGNAANNRLDGGANADTLVGGAGDDTYVVDNSGDAVYEYANAGIDTVESAVSYTLGGYVENLGLTGTAAINGTGNTLNNQLVGNAANNVLAGGAGDDSLNGGAGTDTLAGGSGNDTYLFDRGFGADTVSENDATAGNTDVALFGVGITADQLWFTQSGNNLDVAIIGTHDKFSVSNWYLGNQHHVEQFKTSNGQTLLDSQVQNLVQAMAAFAPPAAGQTTLAAPYQTALAPVLAANWQ